VKSGSFDLLLAKSFVGHNDLKLECLMDKVVLEPGEVKDMALKITINTNFETESIQIGTRVRTLILKKW
jgi:hypothetical protein